MLDFMRDRVLPLLPMERYRNPPPLVAVIRLSGVIAAPSGLMRTGLSLQGIAGLLERAFKLRGLRAVALAINSPGGSPVQSALIGRRIRALAIEHSVPVFAFCEDVAASGGYWLACAADEIYADPASIIGSIGVISSGFGFDEFIRRHGIDRRVYTAGASKGMLDPFRPERPEDVEHLQALQRDIHAQFIAHVKARRGARLTGADSELFTGEFWTGTRALEMGLVDGLGDLRSVLRAKYGEAVVLRPLTAERPGLLRRLMRTGGATDFGAAAAAGALAVVEARALWQRYGL